MALIPIYQEVKKRLYRTVIPEFGFMGAIILPQYCNS